MLSSAVGRSQIHILKLAMLLELGKKEISTTITKESIEIASNAVIKYFVPTLLDVIDRLQEDVRNNQVEKVISVLRRLGGTAKHSKVLHDSKLKAKDFEDVIKTLEESETIEVDYSDKKCYTLKATNINLDKFKIPSVHTIPQIPTFSNRDDINNINNININKYNTDIPDHSVGEEENLENFEIDENYDESYEIDEEEEYPWGMMSDFS